MLLVWRKYIDNAVDRAGCTNRMQGREDQMSCLSGGHSNLHSLVITHFPEEYNIRALAQGSTKSRYIAFCIYVQDPQDPGSYFGTVAVSGACVVTSGGYQRYFEQDGVRYHHILDPKTGRPAASGLQSVSVISQDDTLADALSTALFVMGLDAGAALYRAGDLAFEAVFMTDDGSVWITPGLAGQYQSDRPYQVLQP